MDCIENSAIVRWRKVWSKRVDLYKCSECKAQIAILPIKGTGFEDRATPPASANKVVEMIEG